ncbi:MAG TPA: ATPase, T2SS/T4P/T4SS family [Polyangiaceae bacterium]|nr:ATPase, T2SS/T4P/T4SS family [Polyangiaceae bacterium]
MSPARMDPISGDAVAIVNELVRLAVSQRASDIHLEPKHDMLHVRFRVDGALVDVQPIANVVAPNVVSRVKVLARMDIAERRLPQDGQIAIDLDGGRRVHLRCSTFPASQGEKVVLRILSSQQIIAFQDLGVEPAMQRILRDAAQRPQGFVVTSGPTGAGKTSTLYALMQLIDPTEVNVMTLEDPIEVEISGLTQGQVNVRTGFTFATGLRAILRQDPDVILVGEMRDPETMALAITAAATGQLVLGTLHTMSASQTVDRILDSFEGEKAAQVRLMLAESLKAVLAQRLLRRRDGRGRALGLEVLVSNGAVSALVREKKTFQLGSVIQTGKREGMQSIDESVLQLLRDGEVDLDEAGQHVTNRELLAGITPAPAKAPPRAAA